MILLSTKNLILIALLALYAIFTVYVIYYGPYPASVPLGDPSAYKNTYIHVPIAISSYVLFTVGVFYSLLYLRGKNNRYAEKSYMYISLGLVFATLTLIQGSLWAKESWGTYWNWDPRETGVLLLWFAYLVYLAIRRSISDKEKMLRVSSAYAVAAYIMVPFSFALPYITPSLHPRVQETSRMIGGESAILLPGGILLGVILGIALAEYLIDLRFNKSRYTRTIAYTGIALYIALLLALAPAALPHFGGVINTCAVDEGSNITIKGTVIESKLIDNSINMIVRTEKCVFRVVAQPEKIPLSPLVIIMPASNLTLITIESHNIVVKGTVNSTYIVASEIEILESKSVLINSFLYSLTIIGLMVYALRRMGE